MIKIVFGLNVIVILIKSPCLIFFNVFFFYFLFFKFFFIVKAQKQFSRRGN